MPPAYQIEKSKIIVVEGEDENKFFSALLSRLSLSDIQIFSIGGKTNLSSNLKALRISSDFRRVVSLGIARDANGDPEAAFQSVCSSLQAANLPIPPAVGVASSGFPRVTAMILPDGSSPGMLEDVCLRSVAGQPVMACIDQFFDCIRRAGDLPGNISKAKVHAFLSAQSEPGKRLGEAALAGYWPLENEAYTPLNEFLSSL